MEQPAELDVLAVDDNGQQYWIQLPAGRIRIWKRWHHQRHYGGYVDGSGSLCHALQHVHAEPAYRRARHVPGWLAGFDAGRIGGKSLWAQAIDMGEHRDSVVL